MKNGSILSECGGYRHILWQVWDESKDSVLILSPETTHQSTSKSDTRQIKKCTEIAMNADHGGFYYLPLLNKSGKSKEYPPNKNIPANPYLSDLVDRFKNIVLINEDTNIPVDSINTINQFLPGSIN